ncbi:hypothetical protein F0562_007644 [Nyssa sinensis]|uniref:Uncharacterized protein n=1 Tax=Nyssa sinensis TaxID=561372 RepID=A0A5J5A691_9ASTE|nr:hypothetical protein F0562_007644 [Nyssa sinensis]
MYHVLTDCGMESCGVESPPPRGIKDGRNSALGAYSSPALCGHEILPLKVQNGEYPLGISEIHGGDGSPSQEEQKSESYGATLLFCPTICSKKGLSNKVKNGQNPLGISWTHGSDGRPSQDMQKADGAATFSLALGSNKVGACGEQLVGNALTQGGDVKAIQGRLTTQKGAFSDLMCGNKELSHTAVRGDNTFGVKWEQPSGNPLTQGGEVKAVQGRLTTQKEAFSDLMCSNKELSHTAMRGSNTIGVKGE